MADGVWRDIANSFMTIRCSTPLPLSAADQHWLDYGHGRLVASAVGVLHRVDATMYEELDAALKPHDLYALLRENGDEQVMHIVQGRLYAPRDTNPWLPLILLVLTILSVLYTGTAIATGELGLSDPVAAQAIAENLLPNLWRGLPYAISIMLILGGHEFGHWWQMRRYRISSSLPFFLPGLGLTPLGTFGAGIILREPLRNRRMLLDVGASGPWLGVLIAIPILLLGLSTSLVTPVTGGAVEGNSVLYWLAKVVVFGRPLPDGSMDVMVNQLAWAGWTGLLVTALNLIPLGQLDGGHTAYALLGERARRLYHPIMAALLVGALFFSSAWLLLGLLIALLGGTYAVPLDDVTPLDPGRRRWAWATMGLFGLCFVPIPLAVGGVGDGLLSGLLMSVLSVGILLKYNR